MKILKLQLILLTLAAGAGLLRLAGGVISCIWLTILNKWIIIGQGLVLVAGGYFPVALAMFIGLIFAWPAITLIEKGNHKLIVYTFIVLNIIYTKGVLIAWCVLVLSFFLKHASGISEIPILIWSFYVAITPLLQMGNIDGDNEFAGITLFFISMTYLISIFGILFFNLSLQGVIILFLASLTLNSIIELRVLISYDF